MGAWLEGGLEAEAAGGRLEFICPDFISDIAAKIEYAGPSRQNGNRQIHSGKTKVYPNPCKGFVIVENLEDAHSVQLLTVTGRTLETKPAGKHDRVRFDLTPYPKGVYLLEITARRGSRDVRRIVIL